MIYGGAKKRENCDKAKYLHICPSSPPLLATKTPNWETCKTIQPWRHTPAKNFADQRKKRGKKILMIYFSARIS